MGEGRVLRGQAAYPDVIRSSVSFSEALPECVPIAAVLSPENRHRVRKPLLAELGKTLCCQPQPPGHCGHREGTPTSSGVAHRSRFWPACSVVVSWPLASAAAPAVPPSTCKNVRRVTRMASLTDGKRCNR